jgi:hypothetical protein
VPMSQAERIIIEDNNAANRVAAVYMQAVNDEVLARGTQLALAQQKFSAFLGLKELPSKFEFYCTLAAAFLPMLSPEVFMAKWLNQSEEAVKRALVLSSALGNKKAQAVELLQGGKELAVKAAEANEKVKGLKENAGKFEEAPGTKQIAQLDAASVAVNQLIDCSRRAFAIWKSATLALQIEFNNRLDHAGRAHSETLENMTTRLLPEPPELTKGELEEVQSLYLYQIIGAWASQNVTLTDVVDDWTSSNSGTGVWHSVHRHGLNDNQEATLMDWFGVGAHRGTIFSKPPIVSLDSQLQAWGAPMSEQVRQHRGSGPGYLN